MKRKLLIYAIIFLALFQTMGKQEAIQAAEMLQEGSLSAKTEAKCDEANNVYAVASVEEYIDVYAGAAEESSPVGKLYDSNKTRVLGRENGYVLVSSGCLFGYVEESIAEESLNPLDAGSAEEMEVTYGETLLEEKARLEKDDIGAQLVNFARRYVGNPYRWGGVSLTGGADCSGFVKAVYAQFGIDLPHSSRELRGCGLQVSYEEARPGDIICYSGHVAIYAGNGMIVHAMNSEKGIVVSEAEYQSMICVRRIFDEP